MKKRKRSGLILMVFLCSFLLGACSFDEQGTEAVSGSARPAMSSTEPSPTAVEGTPTPTKRPTATPTPSPVPPSPTTSLLPPPVVRTETFQDEATGDVRTVVRTCDAVQGYTCVETYYNDVLQEKTERMVIETKPAYHRETYYQNGKLAARYETIYTYSDEGLLLGEITIYNDVYYLSGIRYEYKDGLPTHTYFYGEDKILITEAERQYDEKGQETYYKATNVQTGVVAEEWHTEYYDSGQVKSFQILAPRKCSYLYWESGHLHIRDGEIAEGVTVHEEYDELGNQISK